MYAGTIYCYKLILTLYNIFESGFGLKWAIKRHLTIQNTNAHLLKQSNPPSYISGLSWVYVSMGTAMMSTCTFKITIISLLGVQPALRAGIASVPGQARGNRLGENLRGFPHPPWTKASAGGRDPQAEAGRVQCPALVHPSPHAPLW